MEKEVVRTRVIENRGTVRPVRVSAYVLERLEPGNHRPLKNPLMPSFLWVSHTHWGIELYLYACILVFTESRSVNGRSEWHSNPAETYTSTL